MKWSTVQVKEDCKNKKIAGKFGKVRGESGFNILVTINGKGYSIPRDMLTFLD